MKKKASAFYDYINKLTWMTRQTKILDDFVNNCDSAEIMEERIVKKLMTSVKCTSCGQNYQMHDVKSWKSSGSLFSAGIMFSVTAVF